MKFSVKIVRTYQKKQTVGTMTVFSGISVSMVCNTIELAWKNNNKSVSCIPAGKYKCVYRESAKYPKHYHVLDVPNRDFILIHPANFAGSINPRTGKPDLLGCIGVGNGYSDLNNDGIVDLLNSNATMKKMLNIIGKNGFDLEIV